jgi:hypothetical protein
MVLKIIRYPAVAAVAVLHSIAVAAAGLPYAEAELVLDGLVVEGTN